MTNMIETAKSEVAALIEKAYQKAAGKGELPAGATLKGTVEIPNDASNGDYAASTAMAAARDMRLAPKKIAETLVANLELDGSYFASAEVAGPGFINLRLGDKWYGDVIGG
ncbi:MAG: arginine--tRNA ligase, partial [Oscillospiraceae bacterium]|nr:arginine--tRNA ligase [Oscillospiraceae bacterium]